MNRRTIVVGDVHGCIEELDELLATLQVTSADRLVFLGDLMDRGPDPVACVRRVRELGAVSLKGNHEEKHVRWRRHEVARRLTGKKNPIRHFADAMVAQNLALTDDEIAWFAAMPLSVDLGGNWRAVHAGLEANRTFDEQLDCESVLRTRFLKDDGTAYTPKDGEHDPVGVRPFWSERWLGPESIVYGHHIHRFLGPTTHSRETGAFGGGIRSECVGIDTGCYAGGRLTAMVLLPDGRYWFEWATARKVYFPLSDQYGTNKPTPLAGVQP